MKKVVSQPQKWSYLKVMEQNNVKSENTSNLLCVVLEVPIKKYYIISDGSGTGFWMYEMGTLRLFEQKKWQKMKKSLVQCANNFLNTFFD